MVSLDKNMLKFLQYLMLFCVVRAEALKGSSTYSNQYLNYANDIFDPSENLSEKPRLRSNGSSRSRRGVLHLYNMIRCTTSCDPVSYKGYGCYCGLLGTGQPVDGIDRCCMLHDRCYESSNCPWLMQYLVPYYWRCHHGHPQCALQQEGGECPAQLCECDRALSECLRRQSCPQPGIDAVCSSSAWRLLQNVFMLL